MGKHLLELNQQDSSLLKGISILMIIVHNFCHALPNAVIENEFNHNSANFYDWLSIVINGGPHIVSQSFSFWGHYGVSIFLFLSGYGLVKKYEYRMNDLRFIPYMKHNAVKLWKLILIGVLIHIAFNGTYMFKWIPLLFTFTTNLIPGAERIYGPWWFFSLIMQCYCIYALFLYKKKNVWAFGLIVFSLLIQACAINIHSTYNILWYFRSNAFGWMLPFVLGVLMSRSKIKISTWMCTFAMVCFVLCEANTYTWLVSPFFLIIASLLITKIHVRWFRLSLEFIGGLSAMIFVLHPIIRPYFIELSGYSLYVSIIGYVVSSVLLSYICNKIMYKVTQISL